MDLKYNNILLELEANDFEWNKLSYANHKRWYKSFSLSRTDIIQSILQIKENYLKIQTNSQICSVNKI